METKVGLIIGKFYPPHVGHHFLIDTALAECEGGVLVLVLYNSQEKGLSATERVRMIEETHYAKVKTHRLRVQVAKDDIVVDYTNPAIEQQHANLVADAVDASSGNTPTHLYTSEDYGESFASALGYALNSTIEHRMVDLNRIAKPISATKIRANVRGNWDSFSPYAKGRLTKKVVICGAESTGTTTLAKDLAERYRTVWVPEYGRTFSEAVGNHHVWERADFEKILNEQNRMNDDLAQYAGPVMFCDTDNVATLMFYELYMGKRAPDSFWAMAKNRAKDKALYIITHHDDVPFEDDGYRLFASQRNWATNWFTSKLVALNLPHIIVGGAHEERMDHSIECIEPLLKWDFPSVPEHGKIDHLAGN